MDGRFFTLVGRRQALFHRRTSLVPNKKPEPRSDDDRNQLLVFSAAATLQGCCSGICQMMDDSWRETPKSSLYPMEAAAGPRTYSVVASLFGLSLDPTTHE